MWLLAISVPLIPGFALVLHHYDVKITALFRQALALALKLARRRVCVRATHAFVFSQSTHGKVQSVLQTFDLYSDTNPSLSIGPQTGQVLDEIVRRVHPQRVLELGMHCGYASIRMLRLLPPAGRLVTVEHHPDTADLGEELILVAGFKHSQFQVLTSTSAKAIASLHPFLGQQQGPKNGLDLVLMDHDPHQYLTDLLALEREGLLNPSGCFILLINRRPKALAGLLGHLRERPECYSIKGELHGLMEVFYHRDLYSIGID